MDLVAAGRYFGNEPLAAFVINPMKRKRLGIPQYLTLGGGALFVFVLWLSAYFDPTIRWLHFFQAWMYLVPMWLALRGSHNRWGYFIGISAAALWDYTALFVNTFLMSGIRWLLESIHSGKLQHVDQMIAIPAWTANFLVITGCVWAYTRLSTKALADLGRFLIAFVLTTGFFVVCVALFQPRYLPLFRGLLHPHWPVLG